MKWNDVKPGDMIFIAMKLFEKDVFVIVGVQPNDDCTDVQMLSSCNERTETKKHRMCQQDINPVFNVYRDGRLMN